ncbi:MAG: GvpL/GvpF family gas vesicle protein [Myxococcota bacterium]
MGLLYLYGIVREGQPLPTSLVASLEVVSGGGLVALAESVGDGEFSPPVLDQKLQSLEWVAARASAHQAVLDQVMHEGPVVPARLCTMFSGAAALRARLCAQGSRFHALLGAIEGRQEWSVKVYCDRSALVRSIAAREGQEPPGEPSGSPGRDFLLRKRRRAAVARRADEAIDDCVDDVLGFIEDLAFDSRSRSLLSDKTTCRADTMMFNAAVLLDPGAEHALVRALDEVSETHGNCFSIVLGGPWPAYSFCDEVDTSSGDVAEGSHAELH